MFQTIFRIPIDLIALTEDLLGRRLRLTPKKEEDARVCIDWRGTRATGSSAASLGLYAPLSRTPAGQLAEASTWEGRLAAVACPIRKSSTE